MKRRVFILSSVGLTTALAGCSDTDPDDDDTTPEPSEDEFPDGFEEDGDIAESAVTNHINQLTSENTFTVELTREFPDEEPEIIQGQKEGETRSISAYRGDTLIEQLVSQDEAVYTRYTPDSNVSYSFTPDSQIREVEVIQRRMLRYILNGITVELETQSDTELVYTITGVDNREELQTVFKNRTSDFDSVSGELTVEQSGIITSIDVSMGEHSLTYETILESNIDTSWLSDAQDSSTNIEARISPNINAITIVNGGEELASGSSVLIVDADDVVYEVELTESFPSETAIYIAIYNDGTTQQTMGNIPNPVGDDLDNGPYNVVLFDENSRAVGNFSVDN